MAYQVTARKYRPQTFGELVGQEHVRSTLQSALRKGRIAHAYIFSGPRGVGKTTVARILAKAINCEARTAAESEGRPFPDEPCNQCSSCREIVEDRHPDVMEIDGASNTGVDNIRDLREQVLYAPSRGRHKVYVIDEVHMLSKGAFNALLKTLEEPPPGVVFVFATTEPEKIPATVSSRCQCFDFHRLPPRLLIDRLARVAESEGIGVDRAALSLVARTAEGSMRDAQSLFDQVVAYTGGREKDTPVTEKEASEVLGLVAGSVILRIAEMIAREDARSLLETARDIFLEGQDVKQFCVALIGLFRDLLVAEMVEDPGDLLERTPEEEEAIRSLAGQFGRERLHRCFRLVMELERDVRLATNPQPILEMALMRLATLKSAVPLEAVLEKLRAVESALGLRPGDVAGVSRSGDRSGASGGAPPGRAQVSVPPPPSAPEPPSGAPESPDVGEPRPGGQQGLWNRLVREVESLKRLVVHYLDGGQLVSADGGEVKIGVTENNYQFALSHEEVLRTAVKKIWGEGKKVVLVPVSPSEPPPASAPSTNGAPAPANGDRSAQPESEADMLKFMEQVLRDADEIFGDAGDEEG